MGNKEKRKKRSKAKQKENNLFRYNRLRSTQEGREIYMKMKKRSGSGGNGLNLIQRYKSATDAAASNRFKQTDEYNGVTDE